MKPTLVIVGAGLGGCFLADALAESWDVTVIELGLNPALLQKQIQDVGMAVVTDPCVGSGLGGTTTVWHNGLIEIEEEVFNEKWPFSKSELSEYYEQAFHKLSGVTRRDVAAASAMFRQKLIDCGISSNLLGETL